MPKRSLRLVAIVLLAASVLVAAVMIAFAVRFVGQRDEAAATTAAITAIAALATGVASWLGFAEYRRAGEMAEDAYLTEEADQRRLKRDAAHIHELEQDGLESLNLVAHLADAGSDEARLVAAYGRLRTIEGLLIGHQAEAAALRLSEGRNDLLRRYPHLLVVIDTRFDSESVDE